MGFASGLRAGSSMMGSWMDRYEDEKKSDIDNKLFTAGQKLGQDRMVTDAEGNEMLQEAMEFDKMSPSDISGALMKEAMANGLKMSDDLAKFSYGVGEKLFGMKTNVLEHKNKMEMQDLKEQKLKQYMVGRSQLNGMREEERRSGSSNTGEWKPEYNENPVKFFKDYSLSGNKRGEHSARQWGFYDDMKAKNSKDGAPKKATTSIGKEYNGLARIFGDDEAKKMIKGKYNKKTKSSIFGDDFGLDLEDDSEVAAPSKKTKAPRHTVSDDGMWISDGENWVPYK